MHLTCWAENRLPQSWNASPAFAFRYKHPQSSLTFLIKAVQMADKLIVHGMAVEVLFSLLCGGCGRL